METGIVKRFIDDKGFGFISAGPDEPDVFFHRDSLLSHDREPRVGDRVRFVRQNAPKGPRAADVELLSGNR
jgi:cold shock CspA family protein